MPMHSAQVTIPRPAELDKAGDGPMFIEMATNLLSPIMANQATEGSVYNLSVRATDTHQPESHEVWSSPVELKIDPNAAPTGSKSVSEHTQQVLPEATVSLHSSISSISVEQLNGDQQKRDPRDDDDGSG